MGIKTILDEFIAYIELSKLPPEALDPHSPYHGDRSRVTLTSRTSDIPFRERVTHVAT